MTAFALWHEVGLGKTLTITGILGALHAEGKIQRALIVAPVTVVPVWPLEIAKWADYACEVTVLAGSGAKKLEQVKVASRLHNHPEDYWPPLQIIVVNYDGPGRSRKLSDALELWAPDIVVCDEVQRIKSHTANRSKSVHRMSRHAKYRIGATGTPVDNRPEDVFGVYYWLDATIFGGSKTAFLSDWFNVFNYPGGGSRVTLRASTAGEFTKRIHSIAHSASKAECLDLPPVYHAEVPVVLEPRARKLYDDLRDESIAFFDEIAQDGKALVAVHVLPRMTRLQQITSGWVPDEDGVLRQVSTAKIDALREWFDVIDGGKAIVWARFKSDIRAIVELAESLNLNPVFIDGSVPDKKRGDIVEAFQSDASVKVFVGQVKSAGSGITLTAAEHIAFYSYGHALGEEYEQPLGRHDRPGQTKSTIVHHFYVVDSVDETIRASLNDKQEIDNLVTNNWRNLL